jgi:hypothetical protein
LVWDRVLGLNLFPPEVARSEIAYYKPITDPDLWKKWAARAK